MIDSCCNSFSMKFFFIILLLGCLVLPASLSAQGYKNRNKVIIMQGFNTEISKVIMSLDDKIENPKSLTIRERLMASISASGFVWTE